MKQKAKKLLSLFLALAMVLGMLPAMGSTVSAASSYAARRIGAGMTDWKNYETLAAAIAEVPASGAAADNIVELLCNVELTAQIAVSGKKFTLRSDTGDAAEPVYTVKRVFDDWLAMLLLTDGAELALENVVLDGNSANSKRGDGIDATGSTVTLSGSAKVTGNRISSRGGGIRAESSTVVLSGSAQVSGNRASYGGGGIYANGSTVTLSGSAQVIGNTADNGDGGGIYADTSTVTLSGSAHVSGNTASGDGGGIYAESSTVALSGSAQVTGNTAGNRGGGIRAKGSGTTVAISGSPTVKGNKVANNESNFYYRSSSSFSVVGDLTGEAKSIGIIYSSAEPAAGRRFGTLADASYAIGDVFFADNDDALFAVKDGTELKWAYPPVAPTITTEALPEGAVGTPYSATLEATGDEPITWSVTGGTLPDGLTLSGSAISGTPTEAGTREFMVEATNSAGSASKLLSITVNAALAAAGDVYWKYDETARTLYISDSKPSSDYALFTAEQQQAADLWNDPVPWSAHAESCQSVEIEGSPAPASTAYWFYEFKSLTGFTGLEQLNTAAVTNMGDMFALCSSLTTLDLSGFDTSSVTDMHDMFWDCNNLSALDLSGFDTSKVTDMNYMFAGCSSLTSLDLSGFDTSKVTDMGDMFANCSSLTSLDLSGFDTSNVKYMGYMFDGCNNLSALDLSGFDTSKVTDMECMFDGCEKLTTIYAAAGTDWHDSSRTMNNMFDGCISLVGGAGTAYDANNIGGEYARIDTADLPGGQPGYFTEESKNVWWKYDGESNTLYISGTQAEGYAEFTAEQQIAARDEGTPWESYCETCEYAEIKGSPAPASTECWFLGFKGLGEIKNLNRLNTSRVTSMESMFAGCTRLSELDLSGFDTSSVEHMGGMFSDCWNLFSLDLSGFDTSNVKYMWSMFANCWNLSALDLSGFDTQNVENMSAIFAGCEGLRAIDISGFDVAKVTDMSLMFAGCKRLKAIYAAADANWYDSERNMDYMFADCTGLVGGAGTAYDANNIGGEYARIDTADLLGGQPGYFTEKRGDVWWKYDGESNTLYISDTQTDGYAAFPALEQQAVDGWWNMPPWVDHDESCQSVEIEGNPAPASTAYWFYWFKSLSELDLSGFDVANVTDMRAMFALCESLTTIYAPAGTNWYDSKRNMDYMFHGCTSLVGGAGTACDGDNNIGGEYARIDTANMLGGQPGYFTEKTVVSNITVNGGYAYTSATGNTPVTSAADGTEVFIAPALVEGKYVTGWTAEPEVDFLFNGTDAVFMMPAYDVTLTPIYADQTACDIDLSGGESVVIEEEIFKALIGIYYPDLIMMDDSPKSFDLDSDGNDDVSVAILLSANSYSLMMEALSSTNITGVYSVTQPNFFKYSPINIDFGGAAVAPEITTEALPEGVVGTPYSATLEATGDEPITWNVEGTLPDGLTLSGSAISGTPTTAGTFTFTVTATNDGGSTSRELSITVNAVLAAAGDVYWKYDETARTLYISDSKPSSDYALFTADAQDSVYDDPNDIPWMSHYLDCLHVVVEGAPAPVFTRFWFYGFSSLTDIDFSGFDTSNVTDMRHMFAFCSKLTTLDLSGFDTSNVTDMGSMFSDCSSLTELTLSETFDTSQVTDMMHMFFMCQSLTVLDLSGFDTSNVTDMSYIFFDCGELTTLDLSGFETSKVMDMGSMFERCSKLTTLDLSGFDTSKVTDMKNMFEGCEKLTTIYAAADADWYDSSRTMDNMFSGCTGLVGGAGTAYDANNIGGKYARIDGGSEAPGYFTRKPVWRSVTFAIVGDDTYGFPAEDTVTGTVPDNLEQVASEENVVFDNLSSSETQVTYNGAVLPGAWSFAWTAQTEDGQAVDVTITDAGASMVMPYANVTVTGKWTFTPKTPRSVTFVFVSATEGMDLPATVTEMLPNPNVFEGKYQGDEFPLHSLLGDDYIEFSEVEVTEGDTPGKWVFTGWQSEHLGWKSLDGVSLIRVITMPDDDITIEGEWKFVAALGVFTESPDEGWVGKEYTAVLEVDDDSPVTWSISGGSLPAGLSLSADGVISGIPTAAGTFVFTVTASSNDRSAAKELSITVRVSRGESAPVKAIQLAGSTAAGITGSQASSVYFGVYPQKKLKSVTGLTLGVDYIAAEISENNTKNYSIDPIKWQVLAVSDDQYLLISDKNLDARAYHETETETTATTWENSDMRKWLNGMGGVSAGTFIRDAFSETERSYIAVTEVPNSQGNGVDPNVPGGNDTQDKIFLLSMQEVKQLAYGYENTNGNTDTRVARSTDYAIALAYANGAESESGTRRWWLRSPGNESYKAAYISATGMIQNKYDSVRYKDKTVRPAMNLYRGNILFQSAAVGGKAGGVGALTEITNYTGSEWKLTLLDDSRQFEVNETTVDKLGGTVTVTYSGAVTGVNEYISAIIVDENGVATYYGRLKNLTAEAEASGTIEINLSGIDVENKTLCVFNEQYNGDYKTDYAGVIREVPLDSAVAPTITTESLPEGSVGTPYSATLEATGDEPITWSVEGTIPDGLTLSGSTISGMPTTAGTFTFTVMAANNAGSDAKELSITVNAVKLLTESGESFSVGKILRYEGMRGGATNEPTDRGYDPDIVSMTLRVSGASTADDALNMLSEMKFERATTGGFAELSAAQNGNTLTLSYTSGSGSSTFDVMRIEVEKRADGYVYAEFTSVLPGAVRITLGDDEYLLATPGDVNLDGEMNANDWGMVMRVLAEAPGQYDVTDYPRFKIGDTTVDLWTLLADMTSTKIEGERSSLVDANDWGTMMYLLAEAWK